MWESPVNVIMGEMQTQIEGEIFKAIRNVGIDVNKEELIKAMQYDRGQYDKGYKDGYSKAIDEFAERICNKATDDSLQVMLPDGFRADVVTLDYVTEIAVKIAWKNWNGLVKIANMNLKIWKVLIADIVFITQKSILNRKKKK